MSNTVILLTWLVKATALLLLAMGITFGLRRAPAGARYIVWLATLAALLLVPPMSSWSPLPLPILPSEASVVTSLQEQIAPVIRRPESPRQNSALPTATRSPSSAATTSETLSSISPSRMLFIAWAAIVVLLLAWLLLGAVSVSRIMRGARPLHDQRWLNPLYDTADRLELENVPRLMMSSAIEMPFACNVMRPTIVLPASAEQWSDERRRVVLFHELAHIRRRDLLGHTLGRIVCAFYWFHPLVWSAAKRLRAESERACDDLVLASGGARASDYANHLLEIVTSVRMQGAPATALPMADKKEFEGRMLAILDPAVKRATPSRSQTILLTLGLGALSLTIAAAAPTRRMAPPPIMSNDAQASPPIALVDSAIAPGPQEIPKNDQRRSATDTNTSARTSSSTASRTATSTTTSTSIRTDTNKVTTWSSATASITNSVMAELRRAMKDSRLGGQDAGKRQLDTALLGRILRTDKDAQVRKSAAWVLQGHSDGVPLLLERLRVDEAADVREMSAWALSGSGRSPQVMAALTDALKHDKSDEVRATAAWGLGQMRDVDVSALEAALSDPSADVRERALWAMGQHEFQTAPPRVVALLNDDKEDVRLMAAWVLGQIQDKATIPALREAFAKETHSETLQAEFRALVFMGDRSQTMIDRALNHPDPEIRARAVRVIAGQGPGVWPWPWPWPDPRPEP